MLWQRWWSVGSLENDLLKILSSVLRKTKHTCFYFLTLEGIVPEQLWVITSLQPALFCHELHPRASLSCGTLLTTVQWAVSTGRPSLLPLFHTLLSSMLHGEPEDSCDVIITVFPLLGPGQQALGQGGVYLEPYWWSTAFYWIQPQDDTSLKRLGKSEWHVYLTPQSWPSEPDWRTLCKLQCSAFWDDGF